MKYYHVISCIVLHFTMPSLFLLFRYEYTAVISILKSKHFKKHYPFIIKKYFEVCFPKNIPFLYERRM